MNNIQTVDTLKHRLHRLARFINKYRAFMFFLIVALLYSFIIWRINVLVVAEPNQSDVKIAEQNNTVPRINDMVVQKILTLKDNSVNVQTLFQEARNNPFSE